MTVSGASTTAATTATTKSTLVTGAGGFVGQALCAQLLARGRAVSTLCRSALPPALADRVRHVAGDILDPAALAEAMQGVDQVFHLASIAHVYGAPRHELERVIVQGTAQVAAAARQAGVTRLVYFSSSLAAGAAGDGAPDTDYGRAKRAAEEALLAQADGLAVTVLRPVNVYGPGMRGNLATLVRRIGACRLPKLATRLALVGVEDLARAAILAADCEAAIGKIYQVSDGEPYTITALEEAIYRAWGRPQPGWRTPRVVLYGAAAAMELVGLFAPSRRGLGLRTYRNLVTDTVVTDTAINADTGFTPTTTFYKELPALIASLEPAGSQSKS